MWAVSLVFVVLLAACAVGAIYLIFNAKLRGAASEVLLLGDQVAKAEGELGGARIEANAWRDKAEAEREARAAAEVSAARVGGLESELAQLRNELLGLTASRSGLQEQAERVPGLEALTGELNQRIVALSKTVSSLETKLAEQEQAHHEKVAALSVIRGEIEKDLKNIANDSLRDNQASFLQLANAVFEKHSEGAAADLDARREAVEALVSPMREALQACQTNLADLEKARVQAYGALSGEIRAVVDTQNAVRSETSKLVNALRAAPKMRCSLGRAHSSECTRTRGLERLLRFRGRAGVRARGRFVAARCRDPPAGRP